MRLLALALEHREHRARGISGAQRDILPHGNRAWICRVKAFFSLGKFAQLSVELLVLGVVLEIILEVYVVFSEVERF